MSCITMPKQAYQSNAIFKYDTFHTIFRVAMWPSGWSSRKTVEVEIVEKLQSFWVPFSVMPIYFQYFEYGQA